MNVPRVVLRAGLVGVCLVLASCSFAYVQGPPDGHARMDDFTCETSFGLPLIDLGVGAGLVIWGVAAGQTTTDSFGQRIESSATDNLVAGLVLGVPFVAGAAWGAREVTRCRSAKAALAKRAGEASARMGEPTHPLTDVGSPSTATDSMALCSDPWTCGERAWPAWPGSRAR